MWNDASAMIHSFRRMFLEIVDATKVYRVAVDEDRDEDFRWIDIEIDSGSAAASFIALIEAKVRAPVTLHCQDMPDW